MVYLPKKIEYATLQMGPNPNPFDDPPAPVVQVDTPTELERLLIEQQYVLSSEHRCPHCSTRLQELKSVIAHLPETWADTLSCANMACEFHKKVVFLPDDYGQLAVRGRDEFRKALQKGGM